MNILKNSELMIKAMTQMDRELVLKRYAAVYRETRTLLGVGAFSMDSAVQGAVMDMHKRTEGNAELLADEVQYDMEMLAREYMKVYGEEYNTYVEHYKGYNWSYQSFADWCRSHKSHDALTVSPKYL